MVRQIVRSARSFFVRRAVATWPTARGNWKKGLKQEGWILYPVVTVFLLWFVVPQAFQLGFLTGLSFIGASASAIYFGYIFRNPGAIILVYVGVIFGGEVKNLLGVAGDSAIAGDLLSAAVLAGLTTYLWVWAERMKKIDFDWEPLVIKRLRDASTKTKSRSRRHRRITHSSRR